MTEYRDLFASLAAPFLAGEVKTRRGPGRDVFQYITARTVSNRLDDAVGPENWSDDYVPLEHSVICKLSIRLPNGEWVTKCDAGGSAGMDDQGDDDKSAFSDAFKRCAVKWGIGRYLYNDGAASFSEPSAPRIHQPAGASSPPGKMEPPAVASPKAPPALSPPTPASAAGFPVPLDLCPKSGKHLFAWIKDCGARYEIGLLQYLNKWGKLHEHPDRMVDWEGQVLAAAYTEAVRKMLERPEPPEGDDDRVKPARLMMTGSQSGQPEDIPKLQKQLIDVLWKAAAVQSGHDRPNDADYLGTMEMFEHDLGERLCENSVSDCTDRVRLLKFISAAIVYVNTKQQRSA